MGTIVGFGDWCEMNTKQFAFAVLSEENWIYAGFFLLEFSIILISFN